MSKWFVKDKGYNEITDGKTYKPNKTYYFFEDKDVDGRVMCAYKVAGTWYADVYYNGKYYKYKLSDDGTKWVPR